MRTAPAERASKPRARAISTARAILRREGYAALTMERVTAKSGVAKTTLYRHWPSKAALCMEIYLEEAGRQLADPDTGGIEADLRQLVGAVVHLQTKTVAGPALLGLIAEAQIDPSSREAFLAEFAQRRRTLTRDIVRRAIRRGEIRDVVDVELLIDVIGGATTFRLLQGHAPLDAAFIRSLVALVLRGALAR